MYANFMGDPVVQSLAFEDQRHYVVVLCMKCDGLLDRKVASGVRDRLIARALGLDINASEEAKRRLMEVNLVTEKWQPKGWEKRQFKSDGSTERTRKYRKRKETENVPETPEERSRNVTVTDQNRTEQNRTETVVKPRPKTPSIEEVRAYISERGSPIDPDLFHAHYEANGWKQANGNKLQKWKSAVVTWEKRNGHAEPKVHAR